ncbi:threonine/serine exporter ThrE family protein [Corynebacterium sp. UMB10321]|uniref:threonine/serine ThrE exporter family protein n=1 Tax=Corynebacterium sp. UMB10321 TaxID=3046312 RepID=UPI00254E600A|nr:threonine/serine exporter family protein [Corynebacterium sp. UMB10321]MDK8243581.1 threonine/serine exporter family protein [Corynebacterium sp. UMB10321]
MSSFDMGVEASTALRLGALLLSAGAPGYRVTRAVKRCARAMHFDDADVVVGFDTITCTVHRGDNFRTLVADLPLPGVNASRIEALENLTKHEMHRYTTAEEINAAIDEIEAIPTPRWGPLTSSCAAGLACGGFAVLNHFSFFTALLVIIAAGVGQYVRLRLGRRHLLQLGVVMAAALVSTLLFLALAWALPHSDFELSAGFVPAILYLVPGFPLFVSLMDLSRFDFTSGLPRLFFALEVVITMMLTVAVIAMVTDAPAPSTVSTTPDPAFYGAAALASFVSVGGFAILFNASRRMTLLAATLGTVANVLRLMLVDAHVEYFLACLLGTLVIGILGSWLGQHFRVPRTTVTIPAAVVMIPGPTIYAALHQITNGNISAAIDSTTAVVLTVLFLSGGLTVARLLTDKNWAFQRTVEFRPLEEP